MPGQDVDREIGAAALAVALEAGVRVQQAGGYTERVYLTMETLALAMGAERAEASVTSVIVGLTVHRGGWSGTAFRRTPHLGVNFAELSELTQLTGAAGDLAPNEIRQRIDSIKTRRFSPAVVLPMLGLACSAFAALFGSDLAGIMLAGLGGGVGAAVRHVMSGAGFKPFIFCLSAGFAATSVVLLTETLTGTPSEALAACVLFLVPGVPMLNGTADLLATHYLNGVTRLTMSAMIVLSSGLGVSLALSAWSFLP